MLLQNCFMQCFSPREKQVWQCRHITTPSFNLYKIFPFFFLSSIDIWVKVVIRFIWKSCKITLYVEICLNVSKFPYNFPFTDWKMHDYYLYFASDFHKTHLTFVNHFTSFSISVNNFQFALIYFKCQDKSRSSIFCRNYSIDNF